jgi:hypothetical protein
MKIDLSTNNKPLRTKEKCDKVSFKHNSKRNFKISLFENVLKITDIEIK